MSAPLRGQRSPRTLRCARANPPSCRAVEWERARDTSLDRRCQTLLLDSGWSLRRSETSYVDLGDPFENVAASHGPRWWLVI